MISVISAFLLPVSDTVQVPPVNEPCFLQGLYHPVYGSNPYRLIFFPNLVIDFLAAGAVMFQYGAYNQLSLLCNPEPLFP